MSTLCSDGSDVEVALVNSHVYIGYTSGINSSPSVHFVYGLTQIEINVVVIIF